LIEFVLVVFVAVYIGMALGRWPGLMIDRTGIALLGAIILYAARAISPPAFAMRSTCPPSWSCSG
jgi:Na+/H+ antiporter NhaD/arsenite permease-like protein